MGRYSLICGDAKNNPLSTEMIMTDPPFDMPGRDLAHVVNISCVSHVVLLTTMRQLIDFIKYTEFKLSFDFVFDTVAPKKSNSIRQPNYKHVTGAYLKKPGTKSVFNRKLRVRSDLFEENGYWPTIFYAPRERSNEHGMAKNVDAVTDLLGSFEVESVGDPFAGSGTVALAAYALGIKCEMVELDVDNCNHIVNNFKFLGIKC